MVPVPVALSPALFWTLTWIWKVPAVRPRTKVTLSVPSPELIDAVAEPGRTVHA